MVLTQLPLRSLLRKANYIERVVKWAMILGVFDIKYMSHIFIKGQVLADLVVEFAEPLFEENGKRPSMDGKSFGMISLQEPLSWKVYVDSAANQRGLGVGLVVVPPERIIIERLCWWKWLLFRRWGGRTMEIFSNSRLVVGQV